MTPAPLHVRGDMLLMDNSNLSTIATCPRSAYYKLLLTRRLKKSRAALFFGQGIHKALEIRDQRQEIFCTPETQSDMIDALIEHFDGAELDAQEYRNLDYAISTIQKYNAAWRVDAELAITLPDGKIGVELPFALHLGDIPIGRELYVSDPDVDEGRPVWKYFDSLRVIFTGKIDRLCRYLEQLMVLDHKTSSMGGGTFFDEFYTSLQFKGYKWAAENFLGERVSGVRINALICRPPLKSGEANHTFDRQSIFLDDSLVVEWQNTFLHTLKEFIESVIEQYDRTDGPEQAFPMRTNWCVAKYGKCEYFDVCQLAVHQRNVMIHSNLFEEHTWSPLEEEGKPKSTALLTPQDDSFEKLTIAALFGR